MATNRQAASEPYREAENIVWLRDRISGHRYSNPDGEAAAIGVSILGLTLETAKPLISESFSFVPKLTSCETHHLMLSTMARMRVDIFHNVGRLGIVLD
jgi:hypothetical protein